MAVSGFQSVSGTGTAPSPSASGFGTFGSTDASSTTGFASFKDSNGQTVDSLLQIAQAHGGAVAQAANELVHPTTSILSTIGHDLKNAFQGFVNTISIPSEVVAGALSANYTIKQAMDLHILPDQVIFGSQEKGQSIMKKIGNFVVRTATDVLLDPLTYVTFGAGSGSLFGAAAREGITLADETTGVLTKEGVAQLDYLKKVARQQTGLQSALAAGGAEAAAQLPARLKTFQEIKTLEAGGSIAPEVAGMGKDELKRLLNETIDSPLNPDFAKVALSNVLAKNPALTSTLLDQGGVKFFGQSILSGQRIHSVIQMIPGMTWLDQRTEQSRLALASLFNPDIQGFRQANGATQFVRMPPEFMEFQNKASDLVDYMKEERVKNMARIMKANNIDPNTSGQFFMASIENGVMPADPILSRAYKQLLGYNDQELQYLRGAGIPISNLDQHAPHVLVNSGLKILPFRMPPSMKVGAALERTMEGGLFGSSANEVGRLKDELSALEKGTPEYAAKEQSVTSAAEAHQKFLDAQPEWEKAVLEGNKKIINDAVAETKRTGFEIFDDNFFTASIARSMSNVRAGTMKQLVDSLGSNFARKSGEAPEGWVGLDMSRFRNHNEKLVKQGLADSQLVFHPAVAKKIESFTSSMYADEGMHSFLTAFDKLQNVWKASVTSIFPAFHGRNAISNVLLNYNDIGLEALNPVTHGMAAQMIELDYRMNGLMKDSLAGSEQAKTDIHDLMTKDMFTDSHGYKWSYGELRSVVKKNNIALRDNIVGQVDVARTPKEMMDALMPESFLSSIGNKKVPLGINPLSQDFKPYVIGRKFGNAVEGQARLVNFLTNLRKTGDVQLATARTKQFLFDYQNLTAFERTVMKRLIPFYTFTRKNIEAQAKTLMTNPGRTAAQLTSLTNLGDAISGQQLTQAQNDALPDWVKSGINILASKNGSKVTVLQSLGTPIEQPFQALVPNQLLSSVSPYIRLPVELGSGYDFFQQKPLSDVTNATALKNAPDFIKKFVGFTQVSFTNKAGQKVEYNVALDPKRLYLILNLPITSRVLSGLKQIQAADVSTQQKTLQQLIGIRPFAFDLEQESAKRQKEMESKLETLLSQAGVGYQLQRFVPQQQ